MHDLRGDDREHAISLLSRPTDSDAPADERFDPSLLVAKQCSTDFCVHYVPSGADLATPTFAASVLSAAEKVRDFENGTLAWRKPPADDGLGGDDRVDIYLKELASQRMFGFTATDPGQDTQEQHAYLVIDNDFDPTQFNGVPALDSLRLTLAHEYSHVLQYGYDVTADGWHYESSAVWMEHRFDPALDDWVRFVEDVSSGPGWRSLTKLPLTAFDDPSDQPRNAKPYGDAVWNHFLSGRYGAQGDELQRLTWELSKGYESPSTRAYDAAIKRVGGAGIATDFAAFAAATAEWRVPQLGFALPDKLPDVERRGVLSADGPTVTPRMDHLTFALYDVPDTSAARIRLAATFPAGTYGAVALVGRTGAGSAGPVTTRLAQLPTGGTGGVTLSGPHSIIAGGGRVTAVVVNADASQRGFGTSDWLWSRDNQPVAAAITSDLNGPAVTGRTPASTARRVGTRRRVHVTFSKDVTGVDSRSFSLRGPNGKAVPAAVSYAKSSRTAVLTPAAPLADTTRYTVRLTGAIVDSSANGLAPTEWSFTTVRRGPRAQLSLLARHRDSVRFLLSSNDRDRLRWTARLVSHGRTVSRRTGSIGPRASRLVSVAAGPNARGRLVVRLEDPQANHARVVRVVRPGG